MNTPAPTVHSKEKTALALINTHIDNAIKGTTESPNGKWGLNEINEILNCIGVLNSAVNELHVYREKEKEAKVPETKTPAKPRNTGAKKK